MMSRKLRDLNPIFGLKAEQLIAQCIEAGIQVTIVCTLRTNEEQIAAIKSGHSWTASSRHLPDSQGFANAIDLAPLETYQIHGANKLQWDPADPAWEVMGKIGQRLGLIWGGMWEVKDMGHFEEPRH